MSYIVMETFKGYAIVMDNEGAFIKTANLGYSVGEVLDEVIIFDNVNKKSTIKYNVKKLGSLAACICILAAGSNEMLLKTYGTVKISINPDIAISVNRINYVTGVAGLNDDGKSVVEGYKTFGKNIEKVSDELADIAVEMGFLKEDGEILIEVESKNEKWKREKEETIIIGLTNHFENKINVSLSEEKNEEKIQKNDMKNLNDIDKSEEAQKAFKTTVPSDDFEDIRSIENDDDDIDDIDDDYDDDIDDDIDDDYDDDLDDNINDDDNDSSDDDSDYDEKVYNDNSDDNNISDDDSIDNESNKDGNGVDSENTTDDNDNDSESNSDDGDIDEQNNSDDDDSDSDDDNDNPDDDMTDNSSSDDDNSDDDTDDDN